MTREPSSCSCPLPPDMYGSAGWHHRRVDARYWMNRIWADEYAGKDISPDMVRDQLATIATRRPTTVAVEICPRYRAAVAARIFRDKGSKAREHARRDPESCF